MWTLSKLKNDPMTISDIRGIESSCTKMYYHTRMAEEDKRTHHISNLTPGFSFQPFIRTIDQTGNLLGPQATGFISYINKVSGIKGEGEAADAGKKLRTNSIEVFLRRRILVFCNLKCASARENALAQLKPLKIVRECREFE